MLIMRRDMKGLGMFWDGLSGMGKLALLSLSLSLWYFPTGQI